jgi:hypothetical protein
MRALLAIGPAAKDELARLAEHSDPAVAQRAAGALARIEMEEDPDE